MRTGAVRVWGRVGTVEPPWVILPITIEPNKWRLCIDAWEWIYLIKTYPSAMVLQSMLTSSLLFCWLDHCFGPFDLKEPRLRLWPRNCRHPPGPVVALEVYIEMCDYLKVDVRRGYLFRPISPSGDILPGPCDSSAAKARLISYAKKIPDAFKGRHPTLHGLRSGCAISLALYEIKLREIMDHVGWKANATAYHYTKLRQVLARGGAGDTLSRLPSDLTENYRHRNNLFGFTQAF